MICSNFYSPAKFIGSNTSLIKNIISGEHKLSNKIKKSKNPIVIIGESALKGKAGQYIFESLKSFLHNNSLINEKWNSLNILNQQASRVGAIDLGIFSITEKENFNFFDKIENDEFKFIYLLGADNFNFEKKDKFVVYQGSHGDKGAEIADIILPGAAYTEKDGLFINLEGRIQNAFKASFPPGDSREDWIILKNIANMMKKPLGFSNANQLRNLIKNYLKSKIINSKKTDKEINFLDENILIEPIDYYYTNPIARSSKVMNECRQISKKLLFTGIEKAS